MVAVAVGSQLRRVVRTHRTVLDSLFGLSDEVKRVMPRSSGWEDILYYTWLQGEGLCANAD